MNPVTMVAIRQLVGDWGNCPANGHFEVSEEVALQLEAEGKAYRYRPPVKAKAVHPNKMYSPAENK
jgi:hypothetical protein